ncbi:MAG: hypothetical protein V4670_11730 [Bacteroidota bacterium]
MAILNKFGLLFLALILFSCDDILEEDIADDTLKVTSPLEGAVIESNVVNFKWEPLEGASKYRVQVFNQVDSQILDTLIVNKTTFTYPIAQGQYKWQARGENSAYQSKYSGINKFSVIETLDLTNQQVILTSPHDGIYTNATNINCSWQDLAAADTYDFELNNITSGMQMLQQTGISSPNFTINSTYLPDEAKYQWKVKAINATSETLISSNRFFYIDRTIPLAPELIAPNNNASFSIPSGQTSVSVDFKLNASQMDSGIIQSPITSRVIEFSNTNTFNTITSTANINNGTVTLSLNSTGDYYWRVKAIDAATNVGAYSVVFKITVN